jgi:tetratricopeptide (TPR) repeat protein
MSMKRLVCACLTGAVLCLAVAPAGARPPDLPVDTRDECIPQPVVDLGELDTCSWCEPFDATVSIPDDVLARFCQGFALNLIGFPVVDPDLELICCAEDGLEPAAVIGGATAAGLEGADDSQLAQAGRLYRIAERCRRSGDLDMAENCYRETVLLCPGSAYAQKAKRRIHQVKTLRAEQAEDAAEEAEPPQEPDQTIRPDPRARFHDPASAEPPAEASAHETEAKALFRIAERCRHLGDLDMAENCYEETRLLCPDSDYARKAEQHIRQMKARRAVESEDAFEEQEPGATPAVDTPIPPEGSAAALLHETDHVRMVEAKVLYYVGERCRRGGDLNMAYRCYEEAHRACPQCRHAKKALQRMRRIDEDRQTNARMREGQEPSRLRASEVRIDSFFPLIDPQVIPAFDRLLMQEGQVTGAVFDLIEEESRPAPAGEEEEEDYPPGPCGNISPGCEPLSLFVEPPARDLVLCSAHGEEEQGSTAACEDLSDWLRQAVRVMGGAGSLRIDAARLGRLMAQGEGAVRALGCAVVHECGRTYVVYPACPR